MFKNNFHFLTTILMAGTIIGFTFFITEHIKTELRTNLVKQYTEQEQIIAHEVSVVLHAKITSLIDELNLISNIPDVQNGNSIVCNTELKKLVDTLNVKIGNIGRVDKNGVFRCTLNGGLLGSKAEKLGPYINDIFNDPEHKKVMSRAIMPKGVTTYLSAIHVPVYDNKGNFDGTLGGAIYFDKIYEDYLKDILISKNGRVILIDDDGTILSHPVKDFIGKNIKSEYIQKLNNNEHSFDKILSDAKLGHTGTLKYPFEGLEKIAAYAPIEILPGRFWVAMVTIPVDEITTNLDQVGLNTLFLQFILFEVLVVLIIALLYLWLILLHDKKERAVDKAKTEFVSLASHQLRTPLTSIGWYSELLMKEKSEMSEKVLGFIEKIAHANSRMVELVSSLLDVSRLELGTFAITPVKVNVSNILTIVLDELKPLIEKKQMHIEQKSEEHLSLIADEKLFTMILQNLISNAVKYTPAEGTVKINIRKINNNLQIDISDNGIGVTAEDKNRMFTKLFRAANAIKTETDGTGLGLYIVKQAVERLGGTIGFNSELGKGTIFNVTLPITENKI